MDWNSIRNSPRIKNISSLATATVTGNAISAVFWLYLAQLLGEENYGELGYLIAIAGITSNVALLGGKWVMIVYTAKGMDIQPVLYLITLISSGIGAVILYMIFQNPGLSAYVMGFVIFTLVISEIQGRKLYKTYAKFFILQKIFFVSISLGLFQVVGAEGILLGYGLSFVPFFRRMYASVKIKNYDFGFLKQKSGFIANNYSLDVSRALKGQIDKLMIAPLFGFGLLGNYYLGLQVVSVLGILPGAIFTYMLPQDASGRSTQRLRILTILGSVVLALLGVFLAPAIIPMVFPEFEETLDLVPILSMAVIPSTVVVMYTSKFLGREKGSYVLIGHLISIATLISGILILIEFFQIQGLAVAYVLAFSVHAAFLVTVNYVKRDSLGEEINHDK